MEKLEEYLKSLKECPDEMLVKSCGVWDNWPIFIDIYTPKIVRELEESGKFKLTKTTNLRYKDFSSSKRVILKKYWMDYVPGTVTIMLNKTSPQDTRDWILCVLDEDKIETAIQRPNIKNYRTILSIHPYQSAKMKNVSEDRALATAFEEIADYVKEKNINACFGNQRSGLKHSYYIKKEKNKS